MSLGFQCCHETMQEAAGVDQMGGVGFNVVPIPQRNDTKHLNTVEMKTFPPRIHLFFLSLSLL